MSFAEVLQIIGAGVLMFGTVGARFALTYLLERNSDYTAEMRVIERHSHNIAA